MLLLALLLAAEPLHVSISAGTGIGYQSAGVQLAIRSDHLGAFVALGAPTVRGLAGVSGGFRWLRGDGLVLSLQGALQGLPNSGDPITSNGSFYYGPGYSQAAASLSLTAGYRLRRGALFLDLAAGPVAHYWFVAPYKSYSYSRSSSEGGWRVAPIPAPANGSWPLPIDVTLAIGAEL